jgi:hypothetical protein
VLSGVFCSGADARLSSFAEECEFRLSSLDEDSDADARLSSFAEECEFRLSSDADARLSSFVEEVEFRLSSLADDLEFRLSSEFDLELRLSSAGVEWEVRDLCSAFGPSVLSVSSLLRRRFCAVSDWDLSASASADFLCFLCSPLVGDRSKLLFGEDRCDSPGKNSGCDDLLDRLADLVEASPCEADSFSDCAVGLDRADELELRRPLRCGELSGVAFS